MGAADLLAHLQSAGLTLTVTESGIFVRPKKALTDELRSVIRQNRDELMAELRRHGGDAPWTAWDIQRFEDRRDRLLSWGWPLEDAERMADRLVRRHLDDRRVSCTECANFSLGRCRRHGVAGLQHPAISRDFASLLQNCPGFEPEDAA